MISLTSDDFAKAYKAAITMLARREHSAKELKAKLFHKGFKPEVVGDLLKRLQKENLQSDSRFAELFVRRWANKGRGPVKIRMGLGQCGVSSKMIDACINSGEL